MSFDAHENKISDLFNRRIYYIPRNQRKYDWERNNWKELFDDVMDVVTGLNKYHFLGSIVLLKTEPAHNGLPCYSVIDGQQRIATLAIFFTSILYWMKKLGMTDDFKGTKLYVVATDNKNKDVIMVTSESNPSLENIINAIVKINEEDLLKKNYNQIIDGAMLGNNDKRISEAFKFFISEIKNRGLTDTNEQLLHLRDAIIDILFVKITASSEEDSYNIFEILNARGKPLEEYELLKNYIMRYIQPEGTRDKAKDEWTNIELRLGESNLRRFIRHYTIHRYERYRKKYDNDDYKTIRNINRSKDTLELLRDFDRKSSYYLKIVKPTKEGDDANCTEDEFRIFSFFKRKRQEQMRPVLLSLIAKKTEGDLSEKSYNNTINFLYNFFICYSIIGEAASNKITDIVNKYADVIENEYSDDKIRNLIDGLKAKLPSEEMFVNSFKNLGWSHHNNIYEGQKNKEKVKIVLEVLERYNNGRISNDYTIEHIYPDCGDQKNGQIGNLIPLEKRLNEKCKDKDISDKKLIYSQSSFITARNFVQRYEHQNFDPDKRTIFLAKLFYEKILSL